MCVHTLLQSFNSYNTQEGADTDKYTKNIIT